MHGNGVKGRLFQSVRRQQNDIVPGSRTIDHQRQRNPAPDAVPEQGAVSGVRNFAGDDGVDDAVEHLGFHGAVIRSASRKGGATSVVRQVDGDHGVRLWPGMVGGAQIFQWARKTVKGDYHGDLD